jgi:hypothetical protein
MPARLDALHDDTVRAGVYGRLGLMLRSAVVHPDAAGRFARLPPEGHNRVRLLRELPVSPTGGCFLTTATVEFDARPGPLRDAVRKAMDRWLGVLQREVGIAVDAGELPPGTDPADTAFDLNALAAASSYGFQLSRDRTVFARGVARRDAHWHSRPEVAAGVHREGPRTPYVWTLGARSPKSNQRRRTRNLGGVSCLGARLQPITAPFTRRERWARAI